MFFDVRNASNIHLSLSTDFKGHSYNLWEVNKLQRVQNGAKRWSKWSRLLLTKWNKNLWGNVPKKLLPRANYFERQWGWPHLKQRGPDACRARNLLMGGKKLNVSRRRRLWLLTLRARSSPAQQVRKHLVPIIQRLMRPNWDPQDWNSMLTISLAACEGFLLSGLQVLCVLSSVVLISYRNFQNVTIDFDLKQNPTQ